MIQDPLQLIKLGQVDLADTLYVKHQLSNTIEYWAGFAHLAIASKRWKLAEERLQQLFLLDATAPLYYLGYASICNQRGEPGQACEYLESGLRLNAGDKQLQMALCGMLTVAGQADDAVA